MGWAEKTNTWVAKSPIGYRFRLEFSGHKYERKGTRFLKELRAGLATFFAMAYIISVNANIISSSGGPCPCPARKPNRECITDARYMQCVGEVNRDLVTATAAISALSSFAMGICANMPIALAPGMGINAYFAMNVVGQYGSGSITYGMALTAVFVEGLIFVLLTILGLRQWLARTIPMSLKIASGAGIGLYLALIGLSYGAGIGAITGTPNNPLEVAGCLPEWRFLPNGTTIHGNSSTRMYGNLTGVAGTCIPGTEMRSPTMWLGIFLGGLLTTFLMMYRVKGALCIGILLVSIVSWPRSTPVTLFPDNDDGDFRFDFFKKVIAFHPLKHTGLAQDWDITGKHGGDFFIAVITFLYVDILDCTGTLYSMARFCGAIDEDTQDFEGSAVAYLVDAASISLGSLMGLAPVTAFIESGAGISEGGATGLTACVTGICFFISLFFAPIFASIPPWATGCTLILIGAMMARAAVDINWRYVGDSVPAFLTLAIMPFTYSIAYGLIAGIVSYILLNSSAWLLKYLSHNRIVPYDYDHSDYWTARPVGGILPAWLRRLGRGKRDFWREYDFDEEEERREREGRDAPPTAASQESTESMTHCGASTTTRTVSPTSDFAQGWEMPELGRGATLNGKGSEQRIEEVGREKDKKDKKERERDEGVGRFGFVKGPVRNPVSGWRRE